MTSFPEYNIICFFKFSLERDQNLSLLDYPFFLDPTSKVFYIVPDTFYNFSSLLFLSTPLSPFPLPTLLWKVSGIFDGGVLLQTFIKETMALEGFFEGKCE